MRTFKTLMLMMVAAGLPLAACAPQPDPNMSKPVTMPDGRVFYPPPGGWPDYMRGGESGGAGGGRN